MKTVTDKIFVAIPAPDVISDVVRNLKSINPELTGVRWMPVENLHITVFFLGFVETVHIPEIKSAINACLEKAPAFTLHLRGISLEGGRPNHLSMVWARFEKNEGFSRLAGEIGQRVLPYITAPSKFPDPVPHITLARIKHAPYPDVSVNVNCDIEFKGYELWRSVSIPGGVKYEKL